MSGDAIAPSSSTRLIARRAARRRRRVDRAAPHAGPTGTAAAHRAMVARLRDAGAALVRLDELDRFGDSPMGSPVGTSRSRAEPHSRHAQPLAPPSSPSTAATRRPTSRWSRPTAAARGRRGGRHLAPAGRLDARDGACLRGARRRGRRGGRRLGASGAAAVADLAVYGLAGADFPSDVRLLRRAIAAPGLRPDRRRPRTTRSSRCGPGRAGRGAWRSSAARASTRAPSRPMAARRGSTASASPRATGAAAAASGARRWPRPSGVATGAGQRTSLERLVPAYFGLRSPRRADAGALLRAPLGAPRCPSWRRSSSTRPQRATPSPARSSTASPMSSSAMARALIRRLRLSRLDPEVVLAGGVFGTDEPGFHARLEAGIRPAPPRGWSGSPRPRSSARRSSASTAWPAARPTPRSRIASAARSRPGLGR